MGIQVPSLCQGTGSWSEDSTLNQRQWAPTQTHADTEHHVYRWVNGTRFWLIRTHHDCQLPTIGYG